MDSLQNVFPCYIFTFPWLFCYLLLPPDGNHLSLNYSFISISKEYVMPFRLSYNLSKGEKGKRDAAALFQPRVVKCYLPYSRGLIRGLEVQAQGE